MNAQLPITSESRKPKGHVRPQNLPLATLQSYYKIVQSFIRELSDVLSSNPFELERKIKTILQNFEVEEKIIFRDGSLLMNSSQSDKKNEFQDFETIARLPVTKSSLQKEQKLISSLQIERKKIEMLEKEIQDLHDERKRLAETFDSSAITQIKSGQRFSINLKSVSRDLSFDLDQSSFNGGRCRSSSSPSSYIDEKEDNSAKENSGKKDDEIKVLNREISFLNRELKDRQKENTRIVLHFEKILKREKEQSENIIRRLNENLEHKEKEADRLLDRSFNLNENGALKQALNVETLKQCLENLILEKKEITSKNEELKKAFNEQKSDILSKEEQISNLKCLNYELERVNIELNRKYLEVVQHSSEIMQKYDKMVVKLKGYDKFLADLKLNKRVITP